MSSLRDDLNYLLNNYPDYSSLYTHFVEEGNDWNSYSKACDEALAQWRKSVDAVLKLNGKKEELEIWHESTSTGQNEELHKIVLRQIISGLDSGVLRGNSNNGLLNTSQKSDQLTIFYSWQSDMPNSTNRGFISQALEEAVKQIRNDESVKTQPVLDRDTQGVPGSPDIPGTILAKIERSHVFVGDVSIINSGQASRPTPNPNVLLELGYAIKVLGVSRVLLVMNTAFGAPDELPFDLKTKRVIPYTMPETDIERAGERKKLQAVFQEAIRLILNDTDTR